MGKSKEYLTASTDSALTKYRATVVGPSSLAFLLRYELSLLLASPWPGAVGHALRRLLLPGLLGRCGKATVFGQGVQLRHPRSVELGRGVVVDDHCVLDGRSETPPGVVVGDHTMLARNVQVSSKGGVIRIGRGVGVGANSELRALEGNHLLLGDEVMVAPQAYLGGSVYRHDRLDLPIGRQGVEPRGGVRVGEGSWIGASAVVVDGVEVGRHAIVAAGAVVTEDVPDYGIVGGVPARLIRKRTAQDEAGSVPERAAATE